MNSLSRMPPSLAELPARRKTTHLEAPYEFLLRALFRIEEAGESKSAILLLDAKFKDAARLDRFLEQTTFVDHALVFQEGVVWSGPRTYDTFDGFPLVQTRKKEELWPVGTMDRKFGEHGVAYMLCQQELRPNERVSDNVVYGERKKALQNASRA